MSDQARTSIKHTLASVAAFQTFAGAADYTEAAARIHKYWLPAPGNDDDAYDLAEMQNYRPFASFTPDHDGEQSTTSEIAGGGGFEGLQNGMLKVELQRDMTESEQADPREAIENMAGEVRQIHAGFELLAYTAGHAIVSSIDVDQPTISKVDVEGTQGSFVCATLSFHWGVTGLSA